MCVICLIKAQIGVQNQAYNCLSAGAQLRCWTQEDCEFTLLMLLINVSKRVRASNNNIQVYPVTSPVTHHVSKVICASSLVAAIILSVL